MPQRGGQHGRWQQAQQRDRAELAALPVAADGAAPDVPPDPLAEQHREPAVPASQDPVQFSAGVPAGAGHQQDAERGLEMCPRPRGHGVGLVARDAERVGQVGPVQLVTQVQLDDLPLAGGEPGQRRPHHLTALRHFQIGPGIGRLIGHPRRLVERGGAAGGTEPVAALVAGHRVQPGPEPVVIAERGQLRGGDDERVLDGVGRVGGLGEQGPAVGIQARRVAVVGGFESRRVACHDGGDDVAVEHVITVELTGAGPGGFRGMAVSAPESPGAGGPGGNGTIRAGPAPAGHRPGDAARGRPGDAGRPPPGRRAPLRHGRPGAIRPPGGQQRACLWPGAARPGRACPPSTSPRRWPP